MMSCIDRDSVVLLLAGLESFGLSRFCFFSICCSSLAVRVWCISCFVLIQNSFIKKKKKPNKTHKRGRTTPK